MFRALPLWGTVRLQVSTRINATNHRLREYSGVCSDMAPSLILDTLSHCDNGQMIVKVTLARAYNAPALESVRAEAVIVPLPHIAFIAPASKYLYVSVESPT